MKWVICYLAGCLSAVGILSVILHIGLAGCLLLTGLGAGLCPVIKKVWSRGRREREEYQDLTVYMEQMICSYKRLGNIRLALEDCATLFSEESEMGKRLRKSLHILKTGEGVSGADILRGALAEIGERYPSRRLRLLHDFLCDIECSGGEAETSLDILLDDMQMWKQRTLVYQKRKSFVWIETVISAALATGLCGISEFLMPYSWVAAQPERTFYQGTSVIFIMLLLILETAVAWKMTGTWLDISRMSAGMDRGPTGRKQNIFRLRKWTERQRGGNRRQGKKRTRMEIEWEFPYWLLSLSLYLQQNSVYQAVSQSLKQLGGVFEKEVRTFLKGMYDQPSSLEPFTCFFGKWQIPEVQTGMKILYSVNAGGYQDVRKQVHFLVKQSNAIMDKCEGKYFDDQVARMGFLRQIPMILACGKIILDMIKLLGDMMTAYQTGF